MRLPIDQAMEDDASVERQREAERRASERMMLLLTGHLTTEGGSFLIGAGAVLLFGLAYPLVGVWSLLAFPLVFLVAVLAKIKHQA